jgi:hypothetical protein
VLRETTKSYLQACVSDVLHHGPGPFRTDFVFCNSGTNPACGSAVPMTSNLASYGTGGAQAPVLTPTLAQHHLPPRPCYSRILHFCKQFNPTKAVKMREIVRIRLASHTR